MTEFGCEPEKQCHYTVDRICQKCGKTQLEKELQKQLDEANKIIAQYEGKRYGIVESLQKKLSTKDAQIERLMGGIQNVLDQKESRDDKWIIGYLDQLLKETATPTDEGEG